MPPTDTTNTPPSATDRFEKQVTLDVPRSRVWRAITDVTQFGAWFGVSLASPFAPGRAKAFASNSNGWSIQAENIRKYLAA